jgi:1-acyl-sn-glycerol-3-phosphate acyltransferase
MRRRNSNAQGYVQGALSGGITKAARTGYHARTEPNPDNHCSLEQEMRIDTAIVNVVLRALFRLLCRLDAAELDRLPRSGPALLVMNHINFLEAPLVAAFVSSPKLAALSKKENLHNPFYRYFAGLWNAIPIDRGGVDTESFNRCLQWIGNDGILGLAPEGTRSRDGVLRQGKAGVAVLAQRAGVPVWPVAHFGTENFWKNLKGFRRTPISFRVGQPYMIEPAGSMTRTIRQEVADEIMASIARLMPEEYRGPYSQAVSRKPEHLKSIILTS